ncbi:DUF6328 family protein [Massilia sp. 9I]|uniref:DUF6328 family protein n=1 Tax=Massilia sp. 9I TaxID=2653152 RepID=UPI0035A372CB
MTWRCATSSKKRIALPGVQALFGFQTIALFNDRFEELAYYGKACHALGMIMVIISIAVVMTPAIDFRSCHSHATAPMAGKCGRGRRHAGSYQASGRPTASRAHKLSSSAMCELSNR